MAEEPRQKDADASVPAVLRKTGNTRRPPVHETSDPSGRRPVAQWVISGAVVRPAHEVLPDPVAAPGVPARVEPRPGWWLLGVAAGVGFAVAIPLTWFLFTLFAR